MIDRKEAKDIFNNVVSPCEETIDLYSWARGVVETTEIPRDPIVINVKEYLYNQRQENEFINTGCQQDEPGQSNVDHEADNGRSEQEGSGDE